MSHEQEFSLESSDSMEWIEREQNHSDLHLQHGTAAVRAGPDRTITGMTAMPSTSPGLSAA